MKDKIMTEL